MYSTVLLVVVTLLVGVLALPSENVAPCQVKEESATAAGGRTIKLLCDGETNVIFNLEDGAGRSLLSIEREEEVLLRVEYLPLIQDMIITIQGKRFGVNDERGAEEAKMMRALLDSPEFSFFPGAVRVIHDELELKGWESPAVMFLYRLGIAAENHLMATEKRSVSLTRRQDVDKLTYKYHGPNPKLKCTFNGWASKDMDALIADECRGICGQMCSSCWKWVCNDCCHHLGCQRHDAFCDEDMYGTDCATGRGVLWDTTTLYPYDC